MRNALLVLASLAASCASTGGSTALPPGSPGAPSKSASTVTPAPTWQGETQLYARDGSPVNAQPASAQAPGAADRELAPSEGGRMYILELYQKAIDDRDALELEVRSAQAELERARAAASQAQAAEAAGAERLAALQAENQRLLQENIDLAARLATAQIRRLQAEKLLLETRLAELRSTPPPVPAADGADSTVGKL